ncbi:dual specificity testis-specific protein kinase 2-like [Aquarana catesbeiana]|uniref:dual specificity testis-specific protein kinase 2-like n=1 Tax=Aquarana catesbeiana TaxID=8400 RepID=UPI003CC9D522
MYHPCPDPEPLVFQYINSGNLEQLLDSNQHLPWTVRVKLGLDVALGLAYLHFKGIFHRDLTSKNCLIKSDENGFSAVVADFGLAEKIPDFSDGGEKLPVVGFPYWMAPEVLRNEAYNEKVGLPSPAPLPHQLYHSCMLSRPCLDL